MLTVRIQVLFSFQVQDDIKTENKNEHWTRNAQSISPIKPHFASDNNPTSAQT